MGQTIKKSSKFLKKRKIKISLVFLIVSIVLIGFTYTAQADDDGGFWGEVGQRALQALLGPSMFVLNAILYGAVYLAGWFLMLCGRVLNATLSPSLYENMTGGIVGVGWGIVRDVCNLFFILILLIIAFATILRVETYDVKRMLPKLLIIALFINFSKMICGLIIDFSQVLMNTFLNAMHGQNFSQFTTGVSEVTRTLTKDFKWGKEFSLQFEVTKSMGFGVFFFIVLGLVYLFLSVLLLIRIVALWILIILAPLAWLIGIIPTGKKFADQWWNYFIQYCFFGPIMAFFLYLSWRCWDEIEGFTNAAGIAEIEGKSFFSYIVVAILLIASVVVAKSLGVAGAGFMLGGAKRLSGWGMGKVTALPRRAVEKGVRGAGAGVRGAGVKLFGKTLGKLPGLGGVARRMKSEEEGRRIEEARKDYGRYYTTMNKEDLKKEAEHAIGIKRAVASEVALARGLYREWGEEPGDKSGEIAKQTFDKYGLREQARALEEQRPDVAEDKDQPKVIERMGISGLQKLTAAALTPGVMKAIQDQLSPSEFAKLFKSWAKRTQDAAEEAMQNQFSAEFDVKTKKGKANVKARKYFARATGRPDDAFYMNKAGVYGAYRKKPGAEEEAKKYIVSLKSNELANLRKERNWQLAGRYMGPGQVFAAGLTLSEKQKEEMRDIAKKENNAAYQAMRGSDAWATPEEEKNANL